ncbi:MAG: TetR/AcrR family transcriptional regulator [Microthrixaceae bacterium]|nr:TetR/AcrR family transcriptional regulator [Microthrixaceae bacterium]
MVDTEGDPGAGPTRYRARSARGQGETLRRDLLESALELLSETADPDAVSIRAVARRTGVSATACYRHFVDRDDLVYCAVGLAFADFTQRLRSAVAATDDPFAALEAAGDAYHRYALEQPGRYRVLFSNPMDCPEETSATEEEAQMGIIAFFVLVELVQGVIDAGATAAADSEGRVDAGYLAFQLWSWIHGIVDLNITHTYDHWPATEQTIHDALRLLGLTRAEP